MLFENNKLITQQTRSETFLICWMRRSSDQKSWLSMQRLLYSNSTCTTKLPLRELQYLNWIKTVLAMAIFWRKFLTSNIILPFAASLRMALCSNNLSTPTKTMIQRQKRRDLSRENPLCFSFHLCRGLKVSFKLGILQSKWAKSLSKLFPLLKISTNHPGWLKKIQSNRFNPWRSFKQMVFR